MAKARAVVQVGDKHFELQQFAVPRIGPDDARHKIAPEVPAELAALYQPLAAGVSWAHRVPGTKVGDTVVIFSAGQRGIACALGALERAIRTLAGRVAGEHAVSVSLNPWL